MFLYVAIYILAVTETSDGEELFYPTILPRCRTRINTDRFPKWASKAKASSGGGGRVQGHTTLGNFSDFNSPKSPFPGFLSHSDRIIDVDIGQFHWPWMEPCNLESFLFIKNIDLLRKIWLISGKQWKPV